MFYNIKYILKYILIYYFKCFTELFHRRYACKPLCDSLRRGC